MFIFFDLRAIEEIIGKQHKILTSAKADDEIFVLPLAIFLRRI